MAYLKKNSSSRSGVFTVTVSKIMNNLIDSPYLLVFYK